MELKMISLLYQKKIMKQYQNEDEDKELSFVRYLLNITDPTIIVNHTDNDIIFFLEKIN